MPKQRYQHQEPTHAWEQIRPKLTDSAQMTYEIIRPVIFWGDPPKERAAEIGMSMRTIYYKSVICPLIWLLSTSGAYGSLDVHVIYLLC